MIDDCRRRFEAGDKTALLDAVDLCARSGLVMPVWLTEAYCAAYTEWATYGVRSLDEAFGVDHIRKNRKLPDLQERKSLKAAVVVEVNRLRQEMPIDEHLFDRVGAELNIPMGQARDIYYDETNHWRQFNEAIREMPVPGWLKKMVVFEVGELCKGNAPTDKQFAKVGERVNLSAKQVRAIYCGKTDYGAVKTSEQFAICSEIQNHSPCGFMWVGESRLNPWRPKWPKEPAHPLAAASPRRAAVVASPKAETHGLSVGR